MIWVGGVRRTHSLLRPLSMSVIDDDNFHQNSQNCCSYYFRVALCKKLRIFVFSGIMDISMYYVLIGKSDR